MKRISAETIRFTSGGRPWLIVLKSPRAMAFDRWLVKRTGFSLVSLQYSLAGRWPYRPTLLLTTIGARSGDLREAALPYVRYGDQLVVVGSKGGGPVDPAWVHNVRRDGRCWIHLHRKRIPATAREATPQEWPALFDHVTAHKPNVLRYQERAATFGRTIPLVLIAPGGTA